ncbi:hypothetical protein BJF82_03735 [Kytococcus sp. CUA-901]|nr:hypothetical protein BJF82_03735 [Kytococcus sp. CUA-901]
MPKPSALPSSWLPKQMPKKGSPAPSTPRSSSTAVSAVAGSPGPLEKKTPSGPWPASRATPCTASTSWSVESAGRTCTSMPRAASRRGVLLLMPRSTAATVKRCSPCAGTTTASGVETLVASSRPAMAGALVTRSTISARGRSACSPEKMPARIAPRVRRCRVRARVSMPAMPTTSCAASSSSRVRALRQLLGRRAGSRTTMPSVKMRRDSSSSSFHPVLPTCGAVRATICPAKLGSVRVSW